MKKNRLLKVVGLIVPLLFLSIWSFGQAISIHGTVKDMSGAPLPGVTIMQKGTTQGTISGIDGDYSLKEISSKGVLVFSFVGMKTVEVSVNDQTVINVEMKTDVAGLD